MLVLSFGLGKDKTRSCRGGYKGAVSDFFMEWHAENDPNPRNVSLK